MKRFILIILMVFLFVLIDQTVFPAEFDFTKTSVYIEYKNMAVAGTAVSYSGLFFKTVGYSLIYTDIGVMRGLFLYAGIICVLLGGIADLIVAPVLSGLAYYKLVYQNLLIDKAATNSLFWSGMGYISSCVTTVGFIMMGVGRFMESPLFIVGLIVSILGIASGIAFRSAGVILPLYQFKF